MPSGGAVAGRAAALLAAAVLVRAGPADAQAREPREDVAIVVNRTNPRDGLSLQELRRIFLGERGRWENGRRVVLVMREPGAPERSVMLRQVCRMSEREFRQHFLQLLFIGQTPDLPRELVTSNGVVRFVVNVPGAIGYVSALDADSTVKVLRVDGRLPGEAGYPVRMGGL